MSTSVSHDPPASDSVAGGTGPPDRRSKLSRGARGARIAIAIGAALLFSIVGFLVIWTQGHVSGSEFSPTHFQQRDFSFYEIPLLQMQITPIRRTGTTPATATYLRQNGLITTANGAPTTWHLVSISRGLTGEKPDDAELLTAPLGMLDGSNEYWRQWSIDHPENAKILWPVIQRLANRELYILVPALLELAQPDAEPKQLQASIDRYLKSQYAQLIREFADAGRRDVAIELLDEAQTDFPDDPAITQMKI
ncbi:hypothetical protein K227x_65000 [Rubripirellula lacrimiformis]|uniref:Uncharacterized protein n=1 Tax=Rubripirellula lacrimiformis TaxID=1930273 RepID=A0A517NLQ7_9BACT|nr:hypothetical protein [Rubripirellula lacrimiformis]QDT08070.1 hypothetical protein K227x_65000 [Rubripirellula lacrimiformis]